MFINKSYTALLYTRETLLLTCLSLIKDVVHTLNVSCMVRIRYNFSSHIMMLLS